jgi:hypothetical protein
MKRLTEEQEEKGIELMRKQMGIDGNASLGAKGGEVERVKISEAQFFPKLPNYWKQTKVSIYNIISKDADDYIRSYDFNGLHVIASPTKYNGMEWLHVSFSRKSRIPDYKDIQLVRKDFIGTDKKSIMVFPSEEHYVNFAKYCLHLWYSAENPIPDFDVDLGGMKMI